MSNAAFLRTPPRGLALLLGWRRVLVTLLTAAALSVLLLSVWRSDAPTLFLRVIGAAFAALLVFGSLEQWPRHLPGWLARWALQVAGVALVVPASLFLFYVLGTEPGQPAFWLERERLGGFAILGVTGLLLAPWVALTALVRQKEAIARHQALAFELERSELSRQALDARLRLLQAQVEPHFLFNTLANVRALVDAGSPQAPKVLDSLIAYLRAAVPRLQHPGNTFREELVLVRSYLELMHMRMPDRLQYAIHADDGALALQCPPATLMTLVENAIRHGIDPSEDGGRIDVELRMEQARCVATVRDTGVGLLHADDGCGTGLASLQERLHLAFGGEASLQVSSNSPRGVVARIDLPARAEPA
jgi:hypothetical protein